MDIKNYLDATYLKTATQANLSEAENAVIVKNAIQEAIECQFKLIMIRPERIHVGTGSQQAVIERVTFAGSSLRIGLNVGGVKLIAEIPNDEHSRDLVEGSTTNIDVLPDAVRVLPLN